ncbi:hypothetical protein SDC9_163906 [bioreactor metagenome]|uniref:Uncharacterized protein n=1 Tax=bioreactor metagenome TaxID=1076179 RepID=A0A645FQ70_9ZZZZ
MVHPGEGIPRRGSEQPGTLLAGRGRRPPVLFPGGGPLPLQRGGEALHRLRGELGPPHPRPRPPRGGGGRLPGRLRLHVLRGVLSRRGGACRGSEGGLPLHGAPPVCLVGNGGGDDRPSGCPGVHGAGPGGEVRGVLPRPLGQHAGERRERRPDPRESRQRRRPCFRGVRHGGGALQR